MATQPTPEPAPEDMYAIYCGDINAANSHKLVNGLTAVSAKGVVKRLHILFHSWGGFVGDGVFIYNLLKDFPVDVILYNAGQVASAGALAYLGARHRKTTANAVFMIHRSSNTPNLATVNKLKVITESLILDDTRSDSIFRSRLSLPDEIWVKLAYHDVNLSGEDAVKYGFADEIKEFSPRIIPLT